MAVFQPLRSQYLIYIRNRSPAKRLASSPPVPCPDFEDSILFILRVFGYQELADIGFHLYFPFFEAGDFRFGQFFQLRVVAVQGFFVEFEGIQQIFILIVGDNDLLNVAVFFAHSTEFPVIANDFRIAQGNSQVFESGFYRF